MSDESKSKDRPFEFPMMPIFGVDLGERLGDLAAGQRQLRVDIQRLDARMDRLDARMDKLDARMDKLDAKVDNLAAKIGAVDHRVDSCVVAINRMDERINSLGSEIKSVRSLTIGLYVAVAAGCILQFFFK